ncbi:unnamed protein product, partial [Adineta steineri]
VALDPTIESITKFLFQYKQGGIRQITILV